MEQDIQCAVGIENGLEYFFRVFCRGHVSRDTDDLAAVRTDLLHDLLQLIFAASRNHELCAFRSEQLGHRRSHAIACTDDQGNLAL